MTKTQEHPFSTHLYTLQLVSVLPNSVQQLVGSSSTLAYKIPSSDKTLAALALENPNRRDCESKKVIGQKERKKKTYFKYLISQMPSIF